MRIVCSPKIQRLKAFFFLLKTSSFNLFFNQKHLVSTLETLINSFVALNNIKICSKIKNKNSIQKTSQVLINHLKWWWWEHPNETPFIKWNLLIPESIILVVRSSVNRYFLSLLPEFNDILFLLSNHKLKIKK